MKWLLSSALLLAIGMVVLGIVAGRTLRARDAAVREGVLLRASHDVERELRERGPEDISAAFQSLLDRGLASAVELYAADRRLHSAGTPRGVALETPLFLGPAWRGVAYRADGGERPLGMGRGQPPFILRIWPADGVGDSSRLAAVTTWGSVAAALALLAFAVAAARGVEAREKAAALDEERHRLEIVSAAGAGLAHRIRNPLATIKATAQILHSQAGEAQQERTARIVEASVRIESLVQELLSFARPVEVHAEPVDLTELARSLLPHTTGEAVIVRADREHVMAALEELVANARHAGDAEPEVVVQRQGAQAVIEVRDRGAGLQIDAQRAFDPYVTTRADGSGLGLPTIRALVRANGGEVTLTGRDGGGCVARITLPAVSG